MRDTFEKVLRLKEILKFLNEDKFLREYLLLKGGTAINLTVFNLPRLSVDIDMDYTPKMPELISNRYYVAMDADESSAYESLKTDTVLPYVNGEITAANAATLTGKLVQMANGAV